MAKKLSRKQLLKEPDEFITFTGRLIKFMREQRQALVIGAVTLCALIVIVSVVRFVSENNENKASYALESLMRKYEKDLADDSSKAFSLIEKEFDQFLDTYAGKQSGKLGKVFYANLCYDAGLPDKAISLYNEALKELGEVSSISTLILNGLAYAYELKNDYANASKYFEMIVSGSSEVLKDGALYNLGRIYSAMGNLQKSEDAFKKLQSDYPDSTYVNIVKEKLSDEE